MSIFKRNKQEQVSQMRKIINGCETINRTLTAMINNDYQLEIMERTYNVLYDRFAEIDKLMKQKETELDERKLSYDSSCLIAKSSRKSVKKNETELINDIDEYTRAKTEYKKVEKLFKQVEDKIAALKIANV